MLAAWVCGLYNFYFPIKISTLYRSNWSLLYLYNIDIDNIKDIFFIFKNSYKCFMLAHGFQKSNTYQTIHLKRTILLITTYHTQLLPTGATIFKFGVIYKIFSAFLNMCMMPLLIYQFFHDFLALWCDLFHFISSPIIPIGS